MRSRVAEVAARACNDDEWFLLPQEVNALNVPLENRLIFPAAILQPPFFDGAADDAVNYGAMGAVIGHEITHSFDDTGALFDAQGNLRNWWTPQDMAHFKAVGETPTTLKGRIKAQLANYVRLQGAGTEINQVTVARTGARKDMTRDEDFIGRKR